MRCLKSFGERISARAPDRQNAEIQIRVALMSRFSALGIAGFMRVALHQRGKGEVMPEAAVLKQHRSGVGAGFSGEAQGLRCNLGAFTG